MNDAFDGWTEESIATRVVAVCVGVDDARDRLVRDGLDALEERGAIAGELGIDERDAALGDEDRGIAAAERGLIGSAGAGDDIEVVLDLLDPRRLDSFRRRPLRRLTVHRD